MRGLRIGVVHPFGRFGRRIRELLKEEAFPVTELKLFETRTDGGSTLTQFEDDVVITQPLDRDLYSHLDVLFLGEGDGRDLAEDAAAAGRGGVLTIAASGIGVKAPVVASGVNDAAVSERERLLVVARPPSILVGSMLAGLAQCFGVVQACATVLLPASDRGEEGVEELHQQVVKILNFQPPPTKVFKEQVAFNLLLASGESTGPDEAVAEEASELASIETPVSVMMVQAPVFHGYGLVLWVRLAEDVEPEALGKALGAARGITLPRGGKSKSRVPSLISTADTDRILVGRIRRDRRDRGGHWLWVMADALVLDMASHALAVAKKTLGVA